jgi:hypothetical protein
LTLHTLDTQGRNPLPSIPQEVTSVPVGKRKDRMPAYFTEEKRMENEWSYKSLNVKEGAKPGSQHFEYFFVVSEGEKKKCNDCV